MNRQDAKNAKRDKESKKIFLPWHFLGVLGVLAVRIAYDIGSAASSTTTVIGSARRRVWA
jgi:hypothetical protein